MATRATAAELREASDGLLYLSETDAPWAVVDWPTAKGAPTAETVRTSARHRADPAEELSVDAFFAPLVADKDWYEDAERATAARYRQLRDTVVRVLGCPTVVRVGERRVAVYIIGTAAEGGWAGLKTTAVET